MSMEKADRNAKIQMKFDQITINERKIGRLKKANRELRVSLALLLVKTGNGKIPIGIFDDYKLGR